MSLIPFFLVSVLIVGGAVLAAAFLFCAVMDSRQLFPKARVAIVAGSDGSDDSLDTAGRVDCQTGLVVGMIEGMESVKNLCSFTYMSPHAAAEGLKTGEVDAALYLPEGIYDDINTGVNTPVLIRLSASQDAAAGDLFRQLVTDGVSLIRTVEASIYAVDMASADYPTVSTLADAEDRLFGIYVKQALGRTGTFVDRGVSLYGSLSMEQFYTAAALLLILLLFGIGFAVLYNEGEREAVRYMRRTGLRPVHTTFAKILTMTAVLMIMLFVMLLIAKAVFTARAGLDEEMALTLPLVLSRLPEAALSLLKEALPQMLLLTFTMSLVMHFLYVFASPKRAPLVYLLTVLVLFVFTGGLLPLPYLPSSLQGVIGYTPVPLWLKGISGILFAGGAL